MTTGPLTRSAWVDRELRHAILVGELQPGERLMTAALAEKYAVSPTPLREALQRLAAEGLVEITPQRGARVSDLSRRDALEILEVRRVLEPLAVRRSLDSDQGQRLTAGLRRLVRTSDLASAADEIAALAAAEHSRDVAACLFDAADQGQLVRIISTLADRFMRYHVLAIDRAGPADLVLLADPDLVSLVANRDVEQVVERLLSHLDRLEVAVCALGEDVLGAPSQTDLGDRAGSR